MNLDKLLDKSLSNLDLYKIFDNKVNIYTYNELTKFKTLKEAFYPYNIIFILYETSKNYGHWCVLCKNINNIYFFDSYGLFPDEELKFTNKVFRKYNNMLLPHLTVLLLNSNKKVQYNNYKLQNRNETSTSTCGRWCLLYALLYNDVSIDEFGQYFINNKNINPDKHITILTNLI